LTKEDSEIWDATEAELKEAMGRYVAKVIDTKAPELWLAAFVGGAKDPTYLSLAYEFTEMAARDIKSARDGSQMGNDLLPSTKRILEAALVLLIGQIEANRKKDGADIAGLRGRGREVALGEMSAPSAPII
jgi:hypothetical protein